MRVAGSEYGIYELMFRAAPSGSITRPRFLTTLRNVYNFKIAEIHARNDSRMLDLLNRIFDAFDETSKGEIEWRTWLIMYRIAVEPNVFFKDHLRWGYMLFAR